jgi:ferredoxin-fold anticodon binding domain-containing protein
VWYKTAADSEYRNLNLEILQEGYAISSNASQNRYGTVCTDAIAQAIAYEKFVYSKELDPDYPYGEAQEVTLKQLRTHIEEYEGALVAFDATVVMNSSGSIIVEEYDSENDMYYGMTVYYGTSGLNGQGLELLTIGNRLRIVGIVSYWETGGVYQVSGLEYNRRDKDNPRNIKLLSEGHTAGYHEVDAKTFVSSVNVMMEEESKVFDYAGLVLNTSISMKDLKISDIYTTTNDESASKGAMTFTCKANGATVSVRTEVLYDSNGKLVTADRFQGKTIDVKGVVDFYEGAYQIRVFVLNDITIH